MTLAKTNRTALPSQIGWLCVGGPKDGQRITATGNFFQVPWKVNHESTATEPYYNERYYLERLAAGNEIFEIWRWEKLSTVETLQRLIDGYCSRET